MTQGRPTKIDGQSADARLEALGIVLPPLRDPVGNYLRIRGDESLLYLSGQGPVEVDGTRHTGKVGLNKSAAQAYADARLTRINLLAILRNQVGSLTRVRRVVKVFGMVNAAPYFVDHSNVIDGASDLLVAVFGTEIGQHARSAVGMTSLPSEISVEIEIIFAVDPLETKGE